MPARAIMSDGELEAEERLTVAMADLADLLDQVRFSEMEELVRPAFIPTAIHIGCVVEPAPLYPLQHAA